MGFFSSLVSLASEDRSQSIGLSSGPSLNGFHKNRIEEFTALPTTVTAEEVSQATANAASLEIQAKLIKDYSSQIKRIIKSHEEIYATSVDHAKFVASEGLKIAESDRRFSELQASYRSDLRNSAAEAAGTISGYAGQIAEARNRFNLF